MYLKSIKAYGFKSFADKTEINFEKNINGIVGPNGSGKSNIVDAVRWVLGEQSVKSLRGDTSTDVIFSGSKSRKALNSASVTLTFDNEDKHLQTNYSEVSIKRVMYRTGENEYFLNNEHCRLKDITSLFTDSGADKEAFNIISQGKIDEIISTKPQDRRLIFESAAGVLKYKKRKTEALKKLDRTNSNINRVNDIINELKINLEPLRKQSQDAKKYLELKEELKEIDISLITYDITNLNNKLQKTKTNIDTLNDELVSLSSNTSSYDIDILTKKDKIKEIEDSISEKQKLLIELTKNIEKIDANIKVLKERQKYTKESDEISNNIVSLKENILKYDNEINKLSLLLEESNNSHNELLKEQAKIYTELDNTKQKKNKITTKINDSNRDITNLNYKISYLEENINNNNLLPSSIKNILNNPRISGVHNVIGNLISIADEYKTAINIALGPSTNYLVVDTKENAKECVNYLKENNLGRATFYPLDTIKAKYIDEITQNKLTNIKGYINIASNLVTYSSEYQNIIKNSLGNIIIADNIDNANIISNIINHKYRVVTLDGQVVNIGGSITGGSLNKINNIIKEKYKLDSYKRELNTLTENLNKFNTESKLLEQNILSLEEKNYTIKTSLTDLMDKQQKLELSLSEQKEQKESLARELIDLESISNNNTDKELDNLLTMYYSSIGSKDNVNSEITNLTKKKEIINADILEIEQTRNKSNTYISAKEKELNKLELSLNTISLKLDNLLLTLTEEYNITYESAINNYKLELEESLARDKVNSLKSELKSIPYVNLGAIDEFDRINTRYEFLTKQKEDLHNAENTLLEIINEMDEVMQEKFLKTFEEIRAEFKKVFVSMFQGGEAELILTNPDNILETGIEIQAVPSGKKLKSITLLSGGEKTFTAISLLFAILNVRPVPFCLLDEVEAALDDANVESFGRYLYKYRDKTQFILITHKKKTMEFADVLYGITMQESGVSKLVSVRLEDIKK